MQFENDFKAALREGKAEKLYAEEAERNAQARAASVRSRWQKEREEVMLPELNKAAAWLQEENYDAAADKRNGAEVFLRCATHELRFYLDLETYRIVCASSFPELDEQWDAIELFSPLYVQDKLIRFAGMISRIA